MPGYRLVAPPRPAVQSGRSAVLPGLDGVGPAWPRTVACVCVATAATASWPVPPEGRIPIDRALRKNRPGFQHSHPLLGTHQVSRCLWAWRRGWLG